MASVLVLIHVYIDDFAKLLESHGITAKLFADDVKVYFKINSVEDGVLWQQALDLIAVWASEWQLSIYVSKCNLLNIGRSLCELKYSNNSIQLPECETCRDLGVIIASDLPPSVHICEITLKTHQRANHILRCFTSGDSNLLIKAFIVYVRPLLEYNCIIWSPTLKKDTDLLEKIQRRFTKELQGLKHLKNGIRLSRLGLHGLELRHCSNTQFCATLYK